MRNECDICGVPNGNHTNACRNAGEAKHGSNASAFLEGYNKNKTAGNKSASVTGLGADADYAYKDIAEFEEIIEGKVNDAFRDGWNMARTTNKQLRALAGEGP